MFSNDYRLTLSQLNTVNQQVNKGDMPLHTNEAARATALKTLIRVIVMALVAIILICKRY